MTAKLRDIVLALRPSQWTKNVVVLAAFFFAFWDRARPEPVKFADLTRVLPAAVLFCVISSGIYLLNDVRDREADRRHPRKKFRPIAAGRVPVATALLLAACLLGGGLAGAWFLSPDFALVAGAYVLMQLVYSMGLKRISLVDIMVIATGFVLRAIAGAVVLDDVTISAWLLLCTFLLALFLGLCKRRHEKVLLNDDIQDHRPGLEKYDTQFLDMLITITSATTIAAYAIYTFWPETVAKFGTSNLGFTIPFVIFGIFRYLDLVYHHDGGDRPEKILLTDIPFITNLVLYVIALVLVFRLSGGAPELPAP
jgi:4-hydroxybenzoate polyprenyltransferase